MQIYFYHEPPKLRNAINKIQSVVIFIVQFFILHCLLNMGEEIPLIKEKFVKADYPLRFIKSVVNELKKINNVEMKFHLFEFYKTFHIHGNTLLPYPNSTKLNQNLF